MHACTHTHAHTHMHTHTYAHTQLCTIDSAKFCYWYIDTNHEQWSVRLHDKIYYYDVNIYYTHYYIATVLFDE